MSGSSYSIVEPRPGEVLLRDAGRGKSITNDAEDVVRTVLRSYPGRRIFYIDTCGDCDELLHNGSQFAGFGPARGRYL